MILEELNKTDTVNAQATLKLCCGSSQWSKLLAEQRPFSSSRDLLAKAEIVWHELSKEDWLEAFSHHPKIGETKANLKNFDAPDWSQKEQAGVNNASELTQRKLEHLNDDYFKKFGHVFLICATGRSADQMLAALELRLANDSETEITIAVKEQSKITRIRLEKLLNDE